MLTYPEETTFFVAGTPIPQGSKSISRTGHMYEQNKGLKPWRQTIAQAARDHDPFGDRPVEVHLQFRFVPPQRPKFPEHAVKPDVDKLSRAVLDALTNAGIIHDDARVTTLHAQKIYSQQPGVRITIRSTE